MGSFGILKSMTAYGRASHIFEGGTLTVEVQCVNKRFLDLTCLFPKRFRPFEIEAKKGIMHHMARGQVVVSLTFDPNPAQTEKLTLDAARAKGMVTALKTLAEELEMRIDNRALFMLALKNMESPFQESVGPIDASNKTALLEVVEKGVEAALAMRLTEGEELRNDFIKRAKQLQELIDKLQKQAPLALKKMKERVEERIKELFAAQPQFEERVLKEGALIADKVDITEEITRFKSHLQQLSTLLTTPLQSALETKGKKMEFLLQELAREINTIAAKAQDASISTLAVEVKALLEQMKEQAQNIE